MNSVTIEITEYGFKKTLNFGDRSHTEEWGLTVKGTKRISGAFEHESIPEEIYDSISSISIDPLDIISALRKY